MKIDKPTITDFTNANHDHSDAANGGTLSGYATVAHTHAASDVTSGTFADARISESSVTQHEGALTIAYGQLTGTPSIPTTLPDLTDVVSATNTNRFVLVANGTTGYVGRLLVEADISDLQSYLTAEVNDLSAAVVWANVPDANITESSVTQHEGALSIAASQITGILGETNGGTGQSTYATGDILYASGVNTLAKLPVGTNTHILTLAGGVPTWAAPSGSSPLTTKGDIYTYDSADQRLPVGTDGQVLQADSAEATGLKWVGIGFKAFDDTGVTINNTVTETTIVSETVPANTLLGNGDSIAFNALAEYVNSSGVNRNFTLRINVGGITVYADASGNMTSSANLRTIQYIGRIVRTSATTAEVSLIGVIDGTGLATTGRSDFGTNATRFSGIVAIDSIAWTFASDTLFEVSIQHNAADANLTYTHKYHLLTTGGIAGVKGDKGDPGEAFSWIIPLSDETTDLTVGVAAVTIRVPFAMTLNTGYDGFAIECNTPPEGSVIQVDCNVWGTSILSTKATIDAFETTSQSAATPVVISTVSLAANDELTFDIDSVGSTVNGKGLKVRLSGTI